MIYWILEYENITKLIILVFFISILLYLGTYLLSFKTENYEKLSLYECGFNPFFKTKKNFDIQFFLIAILFIIFDVEIMLLFPWCVGNFLYLEKFAYYIMIYFFLILIVGFLYEWRLNALDLII